MTCREAVNEAARIIYTVHDDAKDKDFELELTWVGPESGGRHLPVPKELQVEAERKAKSVGSLRLLTRAGRGSRRRWRTNVLHINVSLSLPESGAVRSYNDLDTSTTIATCAG